MSRNAWHITRGAGGVLLARRPGAQAGGPGIWAECRLPLVPRLTALAHEIRKDIWRALRDVRGFSPVVEIRLRGEETGLWVRAGGVAMAAPPAALQAKLHAVLQDKRRRARWIAHAARPSQ